MKKHIIITFLLICASTQFRAAAFTKDSTYTFENVNWENWHTKDIKDCNYNRREYQNALLSLLKEGVLRDTVEKYLGKSELASATNKDRAYYYIVWDCRTKEATYTFIISYKDNRIVKVRRSIFME